MLPLRPGMLLPPPLPLLPPFVFYGNVVQGGGAERQVAAAPRSDLCRVITPLTWVWGLHGVPCRRPAAVAACCTDLLCVRAMPYHACAARCLRHSNQRALPNKCATGLVLQPRVPDAPLEKHPQARVRSTGGGTAARRLMRAGPAGRCPSLSPPPGCSDAAVRHACCANPWLRTLRMLCRQTAHAKFCCSSGVDTKRTRCMLPRERLQQGMQTPPLRKRPHRRCRSSPARRPAAASPSGLLGRPALLGHASGDGGDGGALRALGGLERGAEGWAEGWTQRRTGVRLWCGTVEHPAPA